MQTLFFRLLALDDKEATLLSAIATANRGELAAHVFHVDPSSFRQVPGSPFAYWVSEKVRRLFTELPSFENEEGTRTTRCGLGTTDNFRFLRLCWEVEPKQVNFRWMPYYDGGVYSLFYDTFPVVVDWANNGSEVKLFISEKFGSASRKVQGEDHYFQAGFVFPRRTKGLSPKVMCRGGIYSNAGQAGFAPAEDLLWTIAILSSAVCTPLIALSQGRTGDAAQFEVGMLKQLPWFDQKDDCHGTTIERLASSCINIKQFLVSTNEISHVYHVPALLQAFGETLANKIASWQDRVADADRQLAEHQREIDEIAFRLYGIDGEDRRAMEEGSGLKAKPAEEAEAEDDEPGDDVGPAVEGKPLTAALLSYMMGCVVGRWDVRFVNCERPTPELLDPFDPLPVCSPGMLQGDDGLPLHHTPEGYPLRIDWDGILVDDPDHSDDIIRVRDVLELIWKDRADAIEKEACEILGAAELRDYFRKPGAGGFWDDHVKRYSKSRRKAPIYWLLQSSKKNYALWIYYHRLGKDILFKALLNYVEPKIRLVLGQWSSVLGQIQQAKGQGQRTKDLKKLEKEAERLESFLTELRDFEDKLRRAANLHLDPDLNDGVVLNIAPLRELVPWKEAKSYWDDLMDGKYEWSSIGKQLREKGQVRC